MCSNNDLRNIIREEMGELLQEHSKQAGLPENIYLDSMLNSFLPLVRSPSFKRINPSNDKNWVHKTIRRVRQLEFGDEF